MNKYILFLSTIIFNLSFTTIAFASEFEKISLGRTIVQLLLYLVVFVGIIFLTIYGTRFLANNYKVVVSSKYMNIVDTLNLPGGAKLVLVKAADKIYILSILSSGTTVVDIIKSEDLPISEDSFDNYLNKYMGKWNLNTLNNRKDKKNISRLFNKKDKEEFKNEAED